jgi:DNA-binding HxlR family transcriptional regulator
MQSQTELILEALGQHDVALLLLRLLDGQATERDLRDALDLSQTAATRALKHLRLVGLVDRMGPRGEYHLTFTDATRDVFAVVDDLSAEIRKKREAQDIELRRRVGDHETV